MNNLDSMFLIKYSNIKEFLSQMRYQVSESKVSTGQLKYSFLSLEKLKLVGNCSQKQR